MKRENVFYSENYDMSSKSVTVVQNANACLLLCLNIQCKQHFWNSSHNVNPRGTVRNNSEIWITQILNIVVKIHANYLHGFFLSSVGSSVRDFLTSKVVSKW